MKPKIWITVATWNKPILSKICVQQLYNNKKDCFLHVSDDHSTKFNAEKHFHADQIEMPKTKLGIQKLRCWEFRKFLKTNYDAIYLTDNDAYHDPNYVEVLRDLYDRYQLPISLYNARAHSHVRNVVKEHSDVYIRKTMPGVSQLYSRDDAIRIVQELDRRGDPNYAWDYRVLEYLKKHCVTPKISYVEHFGGPGSIHNTTLDRDRAINPSEFLQKQSGKIIRELRYKGY